MPTTVHVQAKKLSALQSSVGGCRLFVKDPTTGYIFCVDSGSDVTAIPPTSVICEDDTQFQLYAANGTPIRTFGTKLCNFDLNLKRKMPWRAIVANVRTPILGADFLKHYGLLIDLKNRCLIDNKTNNKSFGEVRPVNGYVHDITTVPMSHRYSDLLHEFSDLSRPKTAKDPVQHNIRHTITTKGPPISAKFRRLDPERLKVARDEFRKLMDLGYIRPSKSPYASPIVVTKKIKDGQPKYRIVGDYRSLNAQTVPDKYPLPHILDITQSFAGKSIFSVIDLSKAFYQIPMHEEDIEKTAVITPFGLYEYTVMPFGLKNAGQTFQRFLHGIFSDLEYVACYIDDICIASTSETEHLANLRTVFERLRTFGLVINVDKCQLGRKEVKFLGYMITPTGVTTLKEKVDAINEFPLPSTVAKLRRFIALVNFYRRFVRNASDIQSPMLQYLKGNKKNDQTKIQWDADSEKAFTDCKQAISNATTLRYHNPVAELILLVDASSIGIGGALHQKGPKGFEPVAFFSTKLTPTQQVYSTYDRELLAAYLAVKHFQPWLEGRHFVIHTDHKPLTHAFQQRLDKASPRQQRHLEYLSQFTTDIVHIPGEANIPADVLSRIYAITFTSDVKDFEMARAQGLDKEWMEQDQNVVRMRLPNCSTELYCHQKDGHVRICVPQDLRSRVIKTVHNLAHVGVKATRKQVLSRYYWPNANSEVAKFVRACQQCQRSKVIRHTSAPVQPIEVPDQRFSHIHIDIVDNLPPSTEGHRYLFTIIDRTTRYVEAVPLVTKTAENCASALLSHWISRFGVPTKITSDQGKQFESELFQQLCKSLGIERIRTTGYHPQSNGIIENWHRTLKASLTAMGKSWLTTLPLVLLGLRTAVRDGPSPIEMVHGSTVRIPGDMLNTPNIKGTTHDFVHNLREKIQQLIPRNTRNNSRRKAFVSQDLKTATHVFLKHGQPLKKLDPTYDGPYLVKFRNDKTFKIVVNGKEIEVSIDRLKPAYYINDQPSDDEFLTSGHHIRFRPQ